MTAPLYRRHTTPSGRHRYLPTAFPECDGLTDGAYTIIVRRGYVQSYRRVTDDDLRVLVAAAEPARRAMERAMLDADVRRPQAAVASPAERRAWQAYVDSLTRDGAELRPLVLQGVSVADVVEAGIRALVEKVVLW